MVGHSGGRRSRRRRASPRLATRGRWRRDRAGGRGPPLRRGALRGTGHGVGALPVAAPARAPAQLVRRRSAAAGHRHAVVRLGRDRQPTTAAVQSPRARRPPWFRPPPNVPPGALSRLRLAQRNPRIGEPPAARHPVGVRRSRPRAAGGRGDLASSTLRPRPGPGGRRGRLSRRLCLLLGGVECQQALARGAVYRALLLSPDGHTDRGIRRGRAGVPLSALAARGRGRGRRWRREFGARRRPSGRRRCPLEPPGRGRAGHGQTTCPRDGTDNGPHPGGPGVCDAPDLRPGQPLGRWGSVALRAVEWHGSGPRGRGRPARSPALCADAVRRLCPPSGSPGRHPSTDSRRVG